MTAVYNSASDDRQTVCRQLGLAYWNLMLASLSHRYRIAYIRRRYRLPGRVVFQHTINRTFRLVTQELHQRNVGRHECQRLDTEPSVRLTTIAAGERNANTSLSGVESPHATEHLTSNGLPVLPFEWGVFTGGDAF